MMPRPANILQSSLCFQLALRPVGHEAVILCETATEIGAPLRLIHIDDEHGLSSMAFLVNR
jgi:hypothetical protein